MMRLNRSWFFILLIVFASALYISIQYKITQKDCEEQLAKAYCSSCHEYTPPSMLSRTIWETKVLPEMGLRLGIGDKNTLLARMQFKLFDQLNSIGIYPDKNIISERDWLSIVHYYLVNSSDSVVLVKHSDKSIQDLTKFKPLYILSDTRHSAQTTMVRYMPKRNQIWIGSRSNRLEKFDSKGKELFSLLTPSPVVDAIDGEIPSYLSIGNMLPNEDRNGRIFDMTDDGKNNTLLIDSLHRPVQMVKADIDRDGIDETIVLEFGFETGQIRLINGKTAIEYIISNQAGARNIHLRDYDKDGYLDLYVLFGQAREQVSLFHNIKGEKFEEQVLLKFPSVNGSSYLDLADMNNDGYEDMILSFGDNADYSIVPKAFHGVQIYLNNQKNQYNKSWFYSTYGATKSIAGDFDGDGDQDIAMIAFFSEPKDDNTFLYFENKSNMKFQAVDIGIPKAKWLTMEADDIDADGDLDLMLGGFNLGEIQSGYQSNIKALILKNTMR
jgi:hypothetical protein